MKRVLPALFTVIFSLFSLGEAHAQGWPSQYQGVMLQAFYWDSYNDTQWTNLQQQADELSRYFSLVWVPQSGNCNGKSMGYDPKYYFDQNSTFGTEKELRTMINTFKQKGLGTIADVVINHRQNKSNWVDFPRETYDGVTYEMLSTDIAADDDNGAAKAWADKNGYKLSANKDSGEGWDGMRDIDHASENVQKIVKAYENFLLNDLGYVGFRYDMGKGFDAKYFSMYNVAAQPQFSVGEVWDGIATIKNWINATRANGAIQSAAFDFQFKYQVRDALKANDWTKVLGNNTLLYGDGYKRYAVTFLENHDTEVRPDGTSKDPLDRDTLAANAFMLVMPGTPCVFLKHWQDCKRYIKVMIEARRLAGIHNESNYSVVNRAPQCIAVEVEGKNSKIIVAVGRDAATYSCSGYKTLYTGYHFRYLVPQSLDISSWQTLIDKIYAETPEPERATLPSCATVQDGTYAYFEKPSSWTNTINVWAWYNDASHSNIYDGASWPGVNKDVKQVGTNGTNKVYLWKYNGTKSKPAMIIFNDGSNQTQDLTFTNGGYYNITGLVDVVTSGISTPIADMTSADNRIFNIGGQYVGNNAAVLKAGLYIQNGKKILIK